MAHLVEFLWKKLKRWGAGISQRRWELQMEESYLLALYSIYAEVTGHAVVVRFQRRARLPTLLTSGLLHQKTSIELFLLIVFEKGILLLRFGRILISYIKIIF